MASSLMATDEYITLNVGGTIYTTTRTTLTTAEPDSMLARLCHIDSTLATKHTTGSSAASEQDGRGPGTTHAAAGVVATAAMPAARRDASGNIVIDRDGPSFRHVLNYLRDGQECVLPGSEYELQQLHREACYFSLEGLVQLAAAAMALRGKKDKQDSAREAKRSRWHSELVEEIQELTGGMHTAASAMRTLASAMEEFR
jgi:hypothetical protein